MIPTSSPIARRFQHNSPDLSPQGAPGSGTEGGSNRIIPLIILFVVCVGGYLFLSSHQRNSDSSSSIAASFSTVAKAQQEALRLFPALGVAGSKFNREFVARHKKYQEESPDYFRDPNWPIILAREVATTVNSQ